MSGRTSAGKVRTIRLAIRRPACGRPSGRHLALTRNCSFRKRLGIASAAFATVDRTPGRFVTLRHMEPALDPNGGRSPRGGLQRYINKLRTRSNAGPRLERLERGRASCAIPCREWRMNLPGVRYVEQAATWTSSGSGSRKPARTTAARTAVSRSGFRNGLNTTASGSQATTSAISSPVAAAAKTATTPVV